MCKFILLWSCCLAAGITMSAQVPLYPVHQQQKWGYIYVRGGNPDMIIKPVYDGFSAELPWHSVYDSIRLSGFRLFEKNGRVGLINDSLREVLPALYQAVYPLSKNYFAVRSDSLVQLVRRGGQVVLPDKFDDLYTMDADKPQLSEYFLTKKGRQQGLISAREGVLFTPTFEQIVFAHTSGLFKIKDPLVRDSLHSWGLANKHGKVLLPCQYADIKILTPRLFAVKTFLRVNDSLVLPKWHMVADLQVDTVEYDVIQLLNSHWIVAKKTRSVVEQKLWSLDSIKPVACNCRMMKPLDEHYLICVEFSLYTLLNNDLSIALKPVYTRIDTSGLPDVYKVRSRNKWGLLRMSSGQTLPAIYDTIGNFADSVALLGNVRWGAVNYKFDTIVPCILRSLQRVDARQLRAQVIDGGDYQSILLDQYFSLENTFRSAKDAQTIEVYDPNTWYAAGPVGTTGKAFPEKDSMIYSYWPDVDIFNPAMIDYWKSKNPKSIIPMVIDTLIGFRNNNQFIRIPYAVNFLDNKVNEIKLYGPDRKRLSGSPLLVGCEPFNRQLSYTVFIDSTGLMGLLDRTGQQGRDSLGKVLRFTYIGPFNCGLANVCIGGKLVLKSGEDEQKAFSIGTPRLFERRFGWMGQRVASPAKSGDYYQVEGNPKWGVIDQFGRFVVVPQYDFISPYYLEDSVARVGKRSADPAEKPGFAYIDNKGKLLFPPVYDGFQRHADYFITELRSKPKYILDAQGSFMLQQQKTPRFCIDGFKEGLSPELDTSGRFGYMDSLGQFVLPPLYQRACNFSEGLAAVCIDSSDYWCFIDHSGQVVFQTTVPKKSPAVSTGRETRAWLGMFKENRCYFREIGKAKYGYYNRQGEQVIKPAFLTPTNFSKGAAAVSTVIKVDKTGLEAYGTIDSVGHYLLKPSRVYENIQAFNGRGKAVARVRETGKYALLSSIGELVTDLYDSIAPYINGYAQILQRGKWGLIDEDGHLLLGAEFAEIGPVAEGLVAAQKEPEGDWTYYDLAGQALPLSGLKKAEAFAGGYARVQIHAPGQEVVREELIDRQGKPVRVAEEMPQSYAGNAFVLPHGKLKVLLDKNGHLLLPDKYLEIQPVHADLFLMRVLKAGWGAVNRQGILVIPPRYNRILPVNNYLQGFGSRLYGLITRNGRELLPPVYENIEEMSGLKSGHVFKVSRGGEVGYYDLQRGWVWPMQK